MRHRFRYAVLLLHILYFYALTTMATAAPERPHIIIIMADDLGFDDVSFRGSDEFLTPNIDALGYHGKILDRFYVPAICTPSRSAALTGKFPIHTGMQQVIIGKQEARSLPTNITTMAEIFQRAGYSTNLIGKWHLGFAKQEQTPTRRGFDYHYGYWGGYIDYYQRRSGVSSNSSANTDSYSSAQNIPNMGYDFRRNLQVECGELGVYVTDLFTNEAERIILANNNTQPLFLMVNHLAVHRANANDPLQAPQEEIRRFAYIKNPERRKYAAMVSKLDQSVGRIIRALERANNALERAIVLFYSDNGAPTVGPQHNSGTNFPLRGQKNTPWEGGLRVPAVIWSADFLSRTTIVRQPLYVADLLPTFAAAAGIQLPLALQLDGLNMWPKISRLTDNNFTIPRDIVHYMDDKLGVVALMHGPWKYVNGTTFYGAYDNQLSYRELYDLDPRQQRYTVEVRNSLASQALSKFDEHRLSLRRIERVRHEAGVSCGQLQHSCNALIEDCLYNIIDDPCEKQNLAREAMYAHVLTEMRELVKQYRATAWRTDNQPSLPETDPNRHDCTWTNFLEESPKPAIAHCDFNGPPCGKAISS